MRVFGLPPQYEWDICSSGKFVVNYRCFGTTYQSHLQGPSSSKRLGLLRNMKEERRSAFLHYKYWKLNIRSANMIYTFVYHTGYFIFRCKKHRILCYVLRATIYIYASKENTRNVGWNGYSQIYFICFLILSLLYFWNFLCLCLWQMATVTVGSLADRTWKSKDKWYT